jgi:nucleotide-binding universal stress UspA family protein
VSAGPHQVPRNGVAEMSAGRIVVGVDESGGSGRALRWAKEQADVTGSDLVVVSAWSPPSASYPSYSGYVPERVPLDIEGHRRAAVETLVKETIGEDAADVRIVQGHPVNVLLQQARGADLVVVGTRGHGQVMGTLLGSVSQRVAAHAPCPVVVVPADRAA